MKITNLDLEPKSVMTAEGAAGAWKQVPIGVPTARRPTPSAPSRSSRRATPPTTGIPTST